LPGGGALTVAAHLDGGLFSLTVENDCPDPPNNPSADGIGLSNATERLRHLFGPNASLQLDIAASGCSPPRPAHAVARATIRSAS
jgi:LytS/YehU family sensor histidine kinase